MSDLTVRDRLRWPLLTPVAAAVVLIVTWFQHDHWIALTIVTIALIASIVAAVHHAEVVAHKVGEPFGSLILAVAVTIIEVA